MVSRIFKASLYSWYSHKIPVHCKGPGNVTGEGPFLNSSSTQYIEDMYNAWLANPSKVHASWDSYFRTSVYEAPPTLVPSSSKAVPLIQSSSKPSPELLPKRKKQNPTSVDSSIIQEHQIVQNVIRAYQARGHLLAKVDPLGIVTPDRQHIFEEIHLEDQDFDKVYTLPSLITYIGGKEKELPLRDIVGRLEAVYCNHIGAEYMYIPDFTLCDWIRKRLEVPGAMEISVEEKKILLHRLIASAGFESFLARKYPSEKRFGLEGCEVLIPAMKSIINRSNENGVENFVIGMPHRGRLNILANICNKPLHKIFTQFQPVKTSDECSGDVKYHLGTYIERTNQVTSKNMRISIVANPSHLETASAVVQGRTKAEQFYRGDCEGQKTLSILLHGDAAFSGQGVVYETINMSGLPDYNTQGTIHIIVNNQIGFTTDPRFSRSSPYCTDVARVVNAPIFHVNSDEPESVLVVSKIASDFRAKFRKDVVIDIVCYRRSGHNEADEPSFTQPLMYSKIKAMIPILTKYSQKLIAEGVVTKEELKDLLETYEKKCEQGLERAKKNTQILFRDWIETPWSGFFSTKKSTVIEPTGVSEIAVKHIGKMFSSPPHNNDEDFVIHSGLKRILKSRMELVENRQIDWALGEAIAFGSLLKDGFHVRLAGQDSERGTFSQRHHVLHHQTVDMGIHNPLCHLYPDQAAYTVCNSPLSEYSALAFELGYSLFNPRALVIWEAQFGDFCNNAQAVIDTMIASGEAKWLRQSGLVLFLPHGMEGQGPEHSSARLERMLQLSDGDPDTFPAENEHFVVNQLRMTNWIVANCTTPANLVHILRRQIALPFRKPLVLMTPKSLLRLPEARSSFDDILEGTEFKRVIPEEGPASKDPNSVKKIIFCSGKVFYDLTKYFKEKKVESQIALTRIEQLVPFPFDLVKQECAKYPQAQVVWCQEEHKNQGGWQWAQPRIETAVAKLRKVKYVGRPVSASTATGVKVQYTKEMNDFLQKAADIGPVASDSNPDDKQTQTKKGQSGGQAGC